MSISRKEIIETKYEEFIKISEPYLGKLNLFEPIEKLDVVYLYSQLKQYFNTDLNDPKNYNSFKYLLKYKGICFEDKHKKREYFDICMKFVIEILNL